MGRERLGVELRRWRTVSSGDDFEAVRHPLRSACREVAEHLDMTLRHRAAGRLRPTP
jgi:hypothetical protein